MICEICGRDFTGKGFKIIVEGAELNVCPSCRKFGGTPQLQHRIPSSKMQPQKGGGDIRPQSRPPTSRQRARSLELVEDYNVVLKNKREKLGLSQADLGKRVNEKESLIHRIETKAIRPSNKVALKIEKELDIKLLEQVEGFEVEKKVSLSRGLTIGDIINFKK
ncbi:MAG: multiprotein bridging factor aMBF1 [Candidatus Methanofastidiosia archaeon]